MQNEITIIGAGIGGLTLAKSLEQKGIPFQLYEKSKSFESLGYGLNVSPNVSRVLHKLGLEKEIAAISHQLQRTQARIFNSDKILLTAPFHNEFPHYQCRRADLHQMIYDSIQDKNRIHFLKKLVGFTQNEEGVELEFGDGTSIKTETVVAADGVKSLVRNTLFPNKKEKYAGYLAYRAILPLTEKYQHLIGQVTFWMGKDHHIVAYPNGNNKKTGTWLNLVLVEKKTEWTEEGWTILADKNKVVQQFSNKSKLLNQILGDMLQSSEPCYKWGLFVHDPLPYWTDKNITLLGDAAHPMVPFQGQGAAMAIEDAYILANCLSKYQTTDKAFARYEILRKERATKVQERSLKNGDIQHASGLKSVIRNLLFAYVNKFQPDFLLKRLKWINDYDATVAV